MRYSILLIVLFTFSVQQVFSQEDSEDTSFFTIVEDMPEYKGGDKKLFKWLKKNTKYPQEAKQQKIEGTVYVQYIVEADGSISNVKVARGVHELLDTEAVRVVSAIEGYSPGRQRGKAVRVQYILPIRFYLGKKPKKKKS